jgi:hypothetical protein
MNPGRLAGAGTPFDWPQSIGYTRQPNASLIAGPWAITAGADGVAIGRFGWVNPSSGQVANVLLEGAALGFVLPVLNMYNWQRAYPCKGSMILRKGMAAVVAAQGVFHTRFPFGALAGARVWTDPATGIAYDSNVTGSYVATGFTVTQNGGCNARLLISSFLAPFN